MLIAPLVLPTPQPKGVMVSVTETAATLFEKLNVMGSVIQF